MCGIKKKITRVSLAVLGHGYPHHIFKFLKIKNTERARERLKWTRKVAVESWQTTPIKKREENVLEWSATITTRCSLFRVRWSYVFFFVFLSLLLLIAVGLKMCVS